MKLLRYGEFGKERPGVLDKDGQIRDLSGHIEDLSGLSKNHPLLALSLLIILFSCTLLILYQNGNQTKSIYVNTEYIFNVVSIVTTTGYSSGDFMSYGSLGPAMFFFLIFIGGCAGSTAGGIKVYRFIVLGQVIKTSLRQLIYSKGVFLLRYGNKLVDQDIYRSTVTMICCFFACLILVTISLAFCGLDFITALSGATTALANAVSYTHLTLPTKA